MMMEKDSRYATSADAIAPDLASRHDSNTTC
jgi:hypothetical protein